MFKLSFKNLDRTYLPDVLMEIIPLGWGMKGKGQLPDGFPSGFRNLKEARALTLESTKQNIQVQRLRDRGRQGSLVGE